MMKKNKYWIFSLVILLLIGLGLSNFYAQNQNQTQPKGDSKHSEKAVKQVDSAIPKKVYRVLKYVETYNKPMKGYVGGREFMNREKKLPGFANNKRAIRYQEWDVNPKVAGKNRGAERLVTGNDQSAWFTADHYRSFKKIK